MDTNVTKPIFGFSEESDQTILDYEKHFGAHHYERLPVVVRQAKGSWITDVEGNYSIDIPDENSVLVYSSVGFVTQEIAVGNL